MKKLSLLALALFCAGAAEARTPRPQMDVVEYAVDAATSSMVAITSYTYVNVISASVKLSSATSLEIYNADSTSYINCGFESNVSTDSTKAAFGREIAPKVGMYYGLNMDKIEIFCKTQSSTGSTKAVITKMR